MKLKQQVERKERLAEIAQRNGCQIITSKDGTETIKLGKLPDAMAAATADSIISKNVLKKPGIPLLSIVKN